MNESRNYDNGLKITKNHWPHLDPTVSQRIRTKKKKNSRTMAARSFVVPSTHFYRLAHAALGQHEGAVEAMDRWTYCDSRFVGKGEYYCHHATKTANPSWRCPAKVYSAMNSWGSW